MPKIGYPGFPQNDLVRSIDGNTLSIYVQIANGSQGGAYDYFRVITAADNQGGSGGMTEVPEPLTLLGSLTAICLGSSFKKRIKNKAG